MLPGKKYSPDEIVRILWKRKWLILVTLFVGTSGGVLAFKSLPVYYQSETLIMVVPQRIPDSYVRSTITAKVEDRLTTISDQILSRSRLERIINDFDLYKEARAVGTMEDVVQRMRADIKAALEGRDSLAFRVSYMSHDPRTAQKVTARLASLYIEENLRDRTDQAESTSQFLESQLEDAERRLLEHEKKLEAYRRTYSGQLPTQLDGNLQAIQNAQLQLQAVSDSINRARERRLLIDRQLDDARTLPLPAMPQSPSAGSPDGVPSMSTGQQLEAAQARLDLFRLRYTADHPDVKALERSIRELQAKLDEEARRNPTDSGRSKQLSVAEAAREKRIRDLQSDLDAVERQIAASVADETRLKGVIAEYQAKVDLLPARESDLVELTRDYTTLQEIYGSLLKKREDSKLAANLERRQIGEQFKILDPASLPEKPFNERQRLLALAGGVGGGLVIGLALVGFLEYRDLSFKSEDDVLRVLTLPVLALVPVMVSDRDREDVQRRRKRKLVVGCTATIAIACVAVIFWGLQF